MEEENKSCSNSSRGIRMTRGLCYIIFPSNKTISFGNVSRNNWIEKKGDSCVGPVTHFRRDKRLPDTGETGSSLCPEAKSRRVRKTLTPSMTSSKKIKKKSRGGKKKKRKKSESTVSYKCMLLSTFHVVADIFYSLEHFLVKVGAGWETDNARSPGRKRGRESMWKRKFRFCCAW